jgi:hypothetical protein
MTDDMVELLAAERALADDLADVLNRWLDHRADPEVETVLARYREARR